MKILWVMNSPIGPAANILEQDYKGTSGGWIQSEYETIEKNDNSFFFLSSLSSVKKGEVLHKKSESGELFCIHAPRLSYGIRPPKVLKECIQNIVDSVNPDVIHIWGTETWLSNAVSLVKTSAPKVIFIQGLLGVHQRYLGGYFGNTFEEKKYTRSSGIISKVKSKVRRRGLKKQALIERETIKECKNVIVDSDFAKGYCRSISASVHCFHHVLLPNAVFYLHKWSLNNCNKHTIFTVYGSSSEKGTQNLLKAVSLVKRSYPDVRVIIPGTYQLDDKNNLMPSRKDAFQNVLYNMIQEMELKDNVQFVGRLNVQQMAETLKHCHIFVNTSCMEVHALSLREALVVGVPCISSLCGSVLEYVENKRNGLVYRYEEYETLAYYIEKLFSEERLAEGLSKQSISALQKLKQEDIPLIEIYRQLLAINT